MPQLYHYQLIQLTIISIQMELIAMTKYVVIHLPNWLVFETKCNFFSLLDAAIINAFIISRDIFDHIKMPHLCQQ